MTPADLRWGAAILLLLIAWLLPRRAAGTPLKLSPALPLDLVLPLAVFALVLLCSARPLLAGVVTLAAGAGWARADRDKRRVLAEPIVFTDVFQTFDIARHPQLAMPFPHKAPLVLAGLATIAFFSLVIWAEPPQWRANVWRSLCLLLMAIAATLLARRLLPHLYAGFRATQLSADPTRDAARHGPFATLLLYGLFARHERAARRALSVPATTRHTHEGPVVLVQSESFFDARRLHPDMPQGLLPQFDRGCRDSLQWGRFAVPSWGANTVRTEFAVLTGLTEEATGFDRFNPYYRFADAPIASLAQTLRAAGYHTVCLHPFDRSFYRRDQVMPQLGFDEFLGEEAFADAPRVNGFVTDVEVAEVAARLLRERGPKLFLFVITIENHGPWLGVPTQKLAALEALPLDADERRGLNHYLGSLANADAMFGLLRETLEALPQPGTLGFYGDHLPSFPTLFPKLGMTDSRSDYLIWRADGGSGQRQDIAAHELGAALLRA
ncbi:MAG: LTA synthase family protein [Pseudomonadota bacterium]